MTVRNFEEAVSKLKPFLTEYLTEKLGIEPGKNFSCIFPDHDDDDPSMSIHGAHTSSPRAHCFGCGKSADIFDACRIIENKPATGLSWVEDTLKYLAEKYGVEIETADLTPEQIYELDTYRAYRAAAALIKSSNLNGEEYAKFHAEVEKRGWDSKIMLENGVGTVPSYSEFRSTLKKLGFTAQFQDEIDLGNHRLFSPDNIVFTWKDPGGRPVGFTVKNLNYEEELKKGNIKASKYLNQKTTGLKCNIFKKATRLYGIEKAAKSTPPLYIFEGQADVITARHHGLLNCVAIGGGKFTNDHVHLLKELNVYELIVCFDGDSAGKDKLVDALEKLSGHRDMQVSIVELPVGEDPDSYLRNFGVEKFKQLGKWSAFEYRLNQFLEEDEPEQICASMIPFIANESSAVNRDKLCNTLSERTGVALKAINEDLRSILDTKARERSRTRDTILGKCRWELEKNPVDAEQILLEARIQLQDFDRSYSSDTLSADSFVDAIITQKELEESDEIQDCSFNLGPDLKLLREWMRGDWTGTFTTIGGKENTGKSALMCKLAWEILANNEDTVVIYHTIDDTLSQTLPRFLCIADGQLDLTINQIRLLSYWKTKIPNLINKRNSAYESVIKMAQSGRLIVKDITSGGSLSYAENLIQYHQEQNPDKRIVYFLDNFHKLNDFSNKDERVRIKQQSNAIKSMAGRLHIPILATVEYTKLAPGIKPTKHNVLETGQIAYDANFMMHLYSEVADLPDNFTVCHRDENWEGKQVFLPRIELLVDKNKLSEMKGHFYLDFWPGSSDYREVEQEKVLAEKKSMQQETNSALNDGFIDKE